jgi:myo-inositol-1(or 4)-monophosphatase
MNTYEFILAETVRAGEQLLALRAQGFSVSAKNADPRDVVTSVDMALSAQLTAAIADAFPGHAIHSEEHSAEVPSSGFLWVIDPIDGTSNFTRGIPHYAVCLGLLEDGVPVAGAVYNPVTRELFSFKKGEGAFLNGKPIRVRENTDLSKATVFLHAGRKEEVRDWGGESYRRLLGAAWKTNNYGSSALDACFVAAGRIEGNVYGTLSTLDIASALGILEEAGGVYATSDGARPALSTLPQRVFMANSPEILDALRGLLG